MRSPRVRFAFRLAIALGIHDPLQWIDQVDPLTLECWHQYDRIEPIPYPWLQSATVAMEAYRVAQVIAASKGITLPTRGAGDFMPQTSVQPAGARAMTVDQMADWAARRVAPTIPSSR